MKRVVATGILLAAGFALPGNADENLNRVPNPEFFGDQGAALGAVTGTIPNFWRAFGINGGDVSMEIVPLAADTLFSGSPATNAVKFTVNSFGAAQGFDHEITPFSLVPGFLYSANVYLKSGNTDGSAQQFNLSFPVFDVNGFTGRQAGSFSGTATNTWASFSGPSFTEAAGTVADIAFRVQDDGDGGENSLLIAMPTVDGPAPATTEISYPPIFTTGRDFSGTDKFVSTIVFHWYGPFSGQQSGPWRPLEGRTNWTGEVPFWRDQIKDIMDANIDVMYVHLIPGFDFAREQLFKALFQLRREGYETPYVLPFLDPLIIWNAAPVDVSQAAGKDEYVSWYIRWFDQYFRNNPDASAESYLLHIDGKVVLNTWHNNPGFVNNVASLTRGDVESRLSNSFAAQYPSFLNGIYQIGSANGLAPPYADEIAQQFSNTEYFSTNTFNGKRPATMKAGYWDQNVRTPGTFFPRNGGVNYQAAWAQLNADGLLPPIYHAFVESWNEYDEGTGIYAGDTGPPLIGPMNTSGNTDQWSATNNPREYIDTTHSGATLFNDAPDLDSLVLWHDVPTTLVPGASADVSILFRNTGDTKWSESAGINLAQSGLDNHTWGPATIEIDDIENEVSKYGGVFRGRPVLFNFTITAPPVAGDYSLNYRMQESAGGGSGFGDTLSLEIAVSGPDVTDITALADITGDGVADVAGFGADLVGRPSIVVYSGDTGAVASSINYINNLWSGVALATVKDANQDGAADDPAVAMLVVNRTTGKIRVETRRVSDGAFLGSIQFLGNAWRPVDVVVVDDLNGDGDTSDSAIAVLSERFSDGRIQVQLRNFTGGALLDNTVYLNARWTPIAAAVANRSAMAPAGTLPPLLGVIAEDTGTGRRTMQVRNAASGAFERNIKFLASTWDYQDVSVNHDANSDGVNDDPVWMVLATRASDDVIRVQSKFVDDGTFDDNIVILNNNWRAFRLDVANDISGNTSQEMVVSAQRRADGTRRIHVKDYGTGATTINIAP